MDHKDLIDEVIFQHARHVNVMHCERKVYEEAFKNGNLLAARGDNGKVIGAMEAYPCKYRDVHSFLKGTPVIFERRDWQKAEAVYVMWVATTDMTRKDSVIFLAQCVRIWLKRCPKVVHFIGNEVKKGRLHFRRMRKG